MTYIKIYCNIGKSKGHRKISMFFFCIKERRKSIKKQITTKDWLPFDKILENGIIVSKDKYIKIIQILPINYNLKSNLEKEAILNSYKLFLKTCDFNIQILIQSKKESLSKTFYNLKEISQNEENEKIKEVCENHIKYLERKNEENKASSKNFYIIISYKNKENKEEGQIITQLNERYFKIKETLSRCGNIVHDCNIKDEVQKIISTFFVKLEGEW